MLRRLPIHSELCVGAMRRGGRRRGDRSNRAGEPLARARVGVLALAQLLIGIQGPSSTVALPSVRHSLDLSVSATQWSVAVVGLALGGGTLLAGRLADAVGRRAVFITGLVGLAAASATSGVASSGAVFVLGRGAAGLSTAAITPAGLALATSDVPAGRERSRRVAVIASALGLGIAVGGPVGGAVVQLMGWRAVFLLGAPIALALAGAGLRSLAHEQIALNRLRDMRRAATSSGSLMAMLVVWTVLLTRGDHLTVIAVALAVALGLFAWTRRLSDAPPLVARATITNRTAATTTAVAAVAGAGGAATVVLLPLYLQGVLGQSSLVTGAAMGAAGVGGVVAAASTGLVMRWLGGPRALLIGLGLQAAGTFTLAAATNGGALVAVLVGLAVAGCGVASVLIAGAVVLTGAAAPADHAAAAGLLNAAAELGAGVGVAALVRVAAPRMASGPVRRLAQHLDVSGGTSDAMFIAALAMTACVILALPVVARA